MKEQCIAAAEKEIGDNRYAYDYMFTPRSYVRFLTARDFHLENSL